MATYVDDCDLDAAKPLRMFVWKVVRTQCAVKDPARMQTFLGVVREAWTGDSSYRGLCLTHSDYTAKILEDAGTLGFGPIRVRTPDPKLLPEQPCDPGVRERIGSWLFLSRCTRFDLSLVVAHVLGFVASSAAWSHIMKSAGGAKTQHLLRCVVWQPMLGEIESQDRGVKRQFLLDRVVESPTRTAERELNRS